ncbi:Tom22 [Carpediemonas membranifera]|uniref:Tom22 n=1 Tax=Carpediemonas membranifera TaxID=201153 RepID=A0A8J6B558_9EUKA|nr:Tom22 [Carpediemonas membranifera]|eukprot:KAG9393239.1 Tom22 [Carpediemonas membranifera]
MQWAKNLLNKEETNVEFQDQRSIPAVDRIMEKLSIATGPMKKGVDTAKEYGKKSLGFGGKLAWIGATTTLVVGVPLIYEIERSRQMSKR